MVTAPIDPFPLQYEPGAIDTLVTQTGGHPNWLQCACMELVNRLNEEKRWQATLADVEDALAQVPLRLSDFDYLWRGRDSSDAQRAVLGAIASAADTALPEGELTAQLSPEFDPKEIRTALGYFLRRDVLVEREDGCIFRSPLLQNWVNQQTLNL